MKKLIPVLVLILALDFYIVQSEAGLRFGGQTLRDKIVEMNTVSSAGSLSSCTGDDTEVYFDDDGVCSGDAGFLFTKGSNSLQLGENGQDGQLVLYNELGVTDRTNIFNLSSSQVANIVYTLPADDGGNGEFLQTNGGGTLDWVGASGSDSHVQYNNGGIFGGESAFLYDDLFNRIAVGSYLAFNTDSFGEDWGSNDNGVLEVSSQGGDYIILARNATNGSNGRNTVIGLTFSNGTMALPTQVVDGATMGRIEMLGYDGDTFIPTSSIRFSAGVTLDNNMPGNILFYTNAGSTSETLRATLDSDGDFGINDSSPSATLSVGGHQQHSGTAPTISSCGGGVPSIVGTDSAGKITIGTGGSVTSCTVTFASTWTNAPACFANNETQILLTRAVSTTTTVVLDAASTFDEDIMSYHCIGRE